MRVYIYYMLSLVTLYNMGCKNKTEQSKVAGAKSLYVLETPGKTDTVADYDGNLYATVKIGTQIWMTSNLKVTHYNNGQPVAMVTGDGQWRTLTTGAFCNYDNDTDNARVYSVLYNWHAITDARKLAPKGWHIPTQQEWEVLITYLGGLNIAGSKLKATETAYWEAPNNTATNQSGFNALPAGDRNNNGIYGNKGFSGTWWTATGEQEADFATNYSIISGSMAINQDVDDRICGLSVRCIKD